MGRYHTFDSIRGRAIGLGESAGDHLRQIMPPGAGKWFRAGAKVGALRGGARVAGMFVRRHPAVLVAAVAGAGLLWYAAHRRSRRAALEHQHHGDTWEGSARRVGPQQAPATPGHVGRVPASDASASSTPITG